MATQESNVTAIAEVGSVEWLMQQDARAMLRQREAIGHPIDRTEQEQVAVLRKSYQQFVRLGREESFSEFLGRRIARNRAELATLAPACVVLPFRPRVRADGA